MVKKKSKSKNKADDSEEGLSKEEKTELRPVKMDDTKSDEENDDDSKFKGRIDVHTLNYFKRVEKFLEEDSFEDQESKELFLNNVMAQIGEGLQTCQLAKHRLTSKVLEQLLGMCSSSQITKTFKSLLVDILNVSDDRFGSHVVQKVFSLIPKHIEKQNDESLSAEIESMVIEFYKLIKEHISELLRSIYCSHIISSFIQVLAGIDLTDTVSRSRSSRDSRTKMFKKKSTVKKPDVKFFGDLLRREPMKVPESFHKTLRKLAKKILEDDNFGELLCHRNASSVIQTLLLGLKDSAPKMCNKLCSLIIEKSRILEWKANEDNGEGQFNKSVPILFADEVGSHIIEKLFYVMSAELYEDLFTKCFSKNLLALCLHPLANYILQHMLATIPNANMAEKTLAELFPFTEDILASGNMGVIVRMAELSLRFKCMQKEFTAALKTSVHLPETKEGKHAFLNLLLTLSTFEIFFEKDKEDERKDENEDKDDSKKEGGSEEASGKLTKEAINYHGACLVKTLLHFDKPSRLVQCLVKMDDELLLLANHEYGSFVLEAFFRSLTISKSKKENVTRKIQKNIVSLATSKFGSHVIDKVWIQADSEQKQEIKEELSKHKSILRGNMYGRIVLRNCGMETSQNQNSFNKQSISSDISKTRTEISGSEKKNFKDTDSGKDILETEMKRKRKIKNNNEDVLYKKELKILGTGVYGSEEIFAEENKISKGSSIASNTDEIDELFETFTKKPGKETKPKKKKK